MARQIGPAAVAGMNPSAKNPDMPASGHSRPDIYVLGEAPGEQEDHVGRQFVGKSGQLLRAELRGSGKRVRFNNVVGTRPPKNRKPTQLEVEAYRRGVEADIAANKPSVLLLVGGTALSWAVPSAPSIQVARGRWFPVSVGGHKCWAMPVLHPAYVLRIKDAREVSGAPGSEWMDVWRRDLARALKGNPSKPRVVDADEIDRVSGGFELLHEHSHYDQVLDFLRSTRSAPAAFDLETNAISPFSSGAKILSFAAATSKRCVAFSVEHADCLWDAKQTKILFRELRKWMTSRAVRIAHNSPFDLLWLAKFLGRSVLRGSQLEDTMMMSSVIDERLGGHSLDFLVAESFGFGLKGISSLDRARLADYGIKDVLRYNALDAYFTYHLYKKLRKRVRDGLVGAYAHRVRAVPTIVGMELVGIPVDQNVTNKLARRYKRTISILESRVHKTSECRKYEARFGRLNISSNKQLLVLFRDVMRRTEVQRGEGFSTDSEALSAMRDVKIASLILKHRQHTKLIGTYVDRMRKEHKRSFVFPDGRIHPNFHLVNTRSGRLASDNPNAQNFPVRTNPEIRSQFKPPAGMRFASFDYGQIEARVIAALSRDKFMMRSLWEGWDIHLEFAKRAIELDPGMLARHGGTEGSVRDSIKSTLTFPLFYGADRRYVVKLLGMPERVGLALCEEFWSSFKGVAEWQSGIVSKYNALGYVESPTGTRRHAPLSKNQLFNTPVQGSASDIVLDAASRLSEFVEEVDDIAFQPVLDIHDDLVFFLPERDYEKYRDKVGSMMVDVPFEWVNVPIEVKCKSGPDWQHLEKDKPFSSMDLHK